MKALIWIIVAIIVIGGIWYVVAHRSSSQQPSTTSTTAAPAAQPILGTNSTSEYGTYLTAVSNGHALYTFDKDANGTTTCYGACAAKWPAYTVASGSMLAVPPGVTGQLSSITRADGSMQLTYNGKPVYFYAPDTSPTDPKGDGVGGVWHLAKP